MRSDHGLVFTVTIAALVALLAACSAPAAPTAAPGGPPAASTSAAPKPATTVAPAAAAPTAGQPAASQPAAPTAAPAAKIKRGGTFVYAGTNDVNSWDPIFQTSSEHIKVIPIYENLVRHRVLDDETGKAEFLPELAESWQLVDPQTIVFKLRTGVKFHDGSDFNAEVGKWVIERAKTHPKSAAKVNAGFIKSVEAPDPTTLKLKLTYPTPLYLSGVSDAPGGSGNAWSDMVSKAAVERQGDNYERNPIGTGPVMTAQYLKDDKLITKKWDGYWRKGADGQSLPYYDGVTFRVIRDAAVILAELRSGTVHLARELEPFQYPAVKSTPDLVLRVMPWASDRMVFGFNGYKPPFGENLKLRQAAQYALDRKAVADAIGFGGYRPNYYVYWVPSNPGYDEKLPHYDYNPEKAKQLLTEAGYPNGLDFNFIVYPASRFKQPSEMMQAQWAKVGLRPQMDVIENVAARQKKKALEFEASSWIMTFSLDIADYDRGLKCEGAANWSSYCNKELDQCMTEGGSLLDFDKRAEVYKRCQKFIYEDALIGGLHLLSGAIAQRKELKDVYISGPNPNIREAWLDK